MMIRTGLIGLGFMGQQHFAIHQAMGNVELLAVADKIPARVAEQADSIGGNIGEAKPLDLSALARYTSLDDLLAHDGLDCIDICTPTYLHADMAVQALEAGKHVICEKPMALTAVDCQRMIDAAAANDKLLFIAQCIRFWPEYELLADWIKGGQLGRIVSAKFTRLSPTPIWCSEGWLLDTALSGGAVTDLHIHDVDFILSVFGMPQALAAQAANRVTTGPNADHIVTQYFYGDFVCMAEGGWGMPGTVPFEMGFQVLGEKGLLEFTLAKSPGLTFYPADGDPLHPEVPAETGYQREFVYFMDCLEKGIQGDRVTPASAKNSVAIVEAELAQANPCGCGCGCG
jgi:predicted dehydrogenase